MQKARSKRISLAREAGLSPDDRRLVEGRLSVNPRGFGFVRPHDGSADLFVPPPIEGAIDGDGVLALHVGKGTEARLLGCLERGRDLAACTYEGRGRVRPDDPKLPRELEVKAGKVKLRKGDKVIVSLVREPFTVKTVVGRSGDAEVDEKAALLAAGIHETFPRAVLREVKEIREPTRAQCKGRVDLRKEVTIVTIDPVDSRDFDDAISIARTKRGGYSLGVHIADVSAYVKPGTALDREARARGFSVYLPSHVIPMLPRRLSNGVCSLREGEDRLTKSVFFQVDRHGKTLSVDVKATVIRPFKRLTYGRASAVMDGAAGEHPQVVQTLRWMRDLAALMGARRVDALSLARPEVAFTYDRAGNVVSVDGPDEGVAHGVIEEFMLAANEAVGRFLDQKGQPVLWRHHPAPSSLEPFCAFTRSLGIPYHKKHSLGSYTRKVRNRPEAGLVAQELLWALPPAEYTPKRRGHFAIAMEYYTHFTSPIRRYADLIVHRALDRVLGMGKPALPDLVPLGEHLSARERLASGVEGRMRRRKVLAYLVEHDRGPHNGLVTQVQKDGLKVELPSFLVWGKLPFRDLPGGQYLVDDLSAQNEDHLFRVGDAIHVEVDEVDEREGRIRFRLAALA